MTRDDSRLFRCDHSPQCGDTACPHFHAHRCGFSCCMAACAKLSDEANEGVAVVCLQIKEVSND